MRISRLLSNLFVFPVLLFVGCGDGEKKQHTSSFRSEKKTPFTGEWHLVNAEDGQFKVLMPSVPTLAKRTVNGKLGEVQMVLRKARAGGIFFNFWIWNSSEKIVEFHGGGTSYLEVLTTKVMRKKEGHTQEFLRTIDNSKHPAIEHKYQYPSGLTSAGFPRESGYSIHRLYLIGNQVCWLFVDVVNSYADSKAERVEKEIETFFDSLEIANPLSNSD